MNLPIPTSSFAGLILAAIFGLIIGVLLQKGRVSDYNVIVNFFRLRDMTVLKSIGGEILDKQPGNGKAKAKAPPAR